mmetsp:Transcript_36880/g.94301  ORF Transcript_36880/g.94301 Transcript_36880/m.94301 type:complete len:237 (+) Transcript_36880:1392-2102(+)
MAQGWVRSRASSRCSGCPCAGRHRVRRQHAEGAAGPGAAAHAHAARGLQAQARQPGAGRLLRAACQDGHLVRHPRHAPTAPPDWRRNLPGRRGAARGAHHAGSQPGAGAAGGQRRREPPGPGAEGVPGDHGGRQAGGDGDQHSCAGGHGRASGAPPPPRPLQAPVAGGGVQQVAGGRGAAGAGGARVQHAARASGGCHRWRGQPTHLPGGAAAHAPLRARQRQQRQPAVHAGGHHG